VLDYRCVVATIWPYFAPGRSGKRVPYRSVGELLESAKSGLGTFTTREIDAFARVFHVEAQSETAPSWGHAERVFNDLLPGLTRTLMVKSAVHLSAGSTVRIRNVATGQSEYGLLMMASTQQPGRAQLQLPSVFQLSLLMPVRNEFPAIDTVVEPLIPPPVNINTAPVEVLTAVLSHVRRSADLFISNDNSRRSAAPPNISPSEAVKLAMEIAAMRTFGDGSIAGASGPFKNWQDLVQRLFVPKLQAEGNNQGRNKWVDLYRCLRTGRDSILEMGTSPICFKSGPWVTYRAAASRSRSSTTAVASRVGASCRRGFWALSACADIAVRSCANSVQVVLRRSSPSHSLSRSIATSRCRSAHNTTSLPASRSCIGSESTWRRMLSSKTWKERTVPS